MGIYNLPAHELHKKLVNKELSAKELAKVFFDRAESLESEIGSFTSFAKEEAIKTAERVDEKLKNGEQIAVLEGIPAAIKDNICIKNMKTTCSSRMLEDFVSPYNATVIDKLNENNAVIMGKTNMDEFAMGSTTQTSYFKQTKNPWNLNKTPGGSSGGSAASVAARQTVWSLGSDTGGSIRQPAAFTGVVGMKPTYGRVSRYGAVAMGSSLDQIGTFTLDVEDCAHILNAISGYCDLDSTSYNIDVPDFTKALVQDIKGMKIGLPKELFAGSVDKKLDEKIQEAIKHLASLGAEFVEVSIPSLEYAVAIYHVLSQSEAASNLSRIDGVKYGHRSSGHKNIAEMMIKSRSEGFGDEVKKRIILGTYLLSSECYETYYQKALRARTVVINDIKKAFQEVDVIISPTINMTAFDLDAKIDSVDMYKCDTFTIPANLAGLPSISIPCGFVDNMPVGLQIMGKLFDENSVLKTAFAFEQSTDFHKNIAPIGGK